MKVGISNYRKQKEFRAGILKELDSIIKEETRVRSLRQAMIVETATDYVLEQLADEKNVKKAFKEAVEAIGSGTSPKTDVVTTLYKSFLADSSNLAAVDAKLS